MDPSPDDVSIDLVALDAPAELRRVRAAQRKAEEAYARARRLVFDVVPGRERDALTPEQQAALAALERAEAELDVARREMHAAQGPTPG